MSSSRWCPRILTAFLRWATLSPGHCWSFWAAQGARDAAAAGSFSQRVLLHRRKRLRGGPGAGGAAVVRSRQLRADVVLGRRAKRRVALRRVLTILLHRSCVVRVMSRALIVSASSCMSHSLVAQLVIDRIHRHVISQNSPARSLHVVHDARCGQNSWNSVGDGVVRGRGVCVRGETKSPSTSTRCRVRRPAVDDFAHAQQASRKLHVETWAGLLQGPDLRISQEVKIVPGWPVTVARSSCPFHSSVSPGPGRIIRNMLGLVTDGENR